MELSADYLREKLQRDLEAEHVEVEDTTPGRCATSFRVLVVSAKFEGKPLLHRHRFSVDCHIRKPVVALSRRHGRMSKSPGWSPSQPQWPLPPALCCRCLPRCHQMIAAPILWRSEMRTVPAALSSPALISGFSNCHGPSPQRQRLTRAQADSCALLDSPSRFLLTCSMA
ncbi:bolA-like protein 2 isoform X1 [Marmota marmota marmota]|uniref:bolA-like protein 2 isoform X1 n=1 Tax=Marmota marmota marmota TaxID=9994 RepID=UPI00209251D3|nr:bolA-like protein 2 isoform X1 [Marmota marmota marmota]